jgi:RNA recognition motif-containing protein
MKKLYVGNLPFDVTDAELTELFSPHGAVQSVQIVTDRDTGRSRGFGFVEMSDGADQAIAALNGQDFKGRSLTVNEARPRKEGGGGGRGGFRSGGGGGGGGGGGRRGGFGGRRY